MNVLPKEEFEVLTAEHETPCLSFYIPTVRAGAEIQQNPIRLKNLLHEAEDRLMEAGMRRSEVQELLQQPTDLLSDEPFWQHQSDGLALFLSPDFYTFYRLPLHFESQLLIGDRFHLKPLMPLYSGNGRFWVLSLSQNSVRLLSASRYSVDEVELEDMPTSLAEALRWDDKEDHLQWDASRGAPTGGARPVATYHGHGVGEQDQKTDIKRYFQKIDKGLQEFLAGDNVPLVLIGVEYLLPIYREVNTYPHLMDEGITGNADDISAEKLHQLAWNVVEPHFMADQEAAADLYRQWSGSERATDDITTILNGAYDKRIKRLFVPLGTEAWGTYDPSDRQASLDQEDTTENMDLLDLAAVKTFQSGGTVYVVEPDDMPEAVTAAAVFRY